MSRGDENAKRLQFSMKTLCLAQVIGGISAAIVIVFWRSLLPFVFLVVPLLVLIGAEFCWFLYKAINVQPDDQKKRE